MTGRVIGAGVAAVLALGACALPPPTVREVSNPDTSGPGFSHGAPKPSDDTYDEHACGGDHGMLEEMNDDDRGRIRLGPPQMSICR
jgi:hypothetical protein